MNAIHAVTSRQKAGPKPQDRTDQTLSKKIATQLDSLATEDHASKSKAPFSTLSLRIHIYDRCRAFKITTLGCFYIPKYGT